MKNPASLFVVCIPGLLSASILIDRAAPAQEGAGTATAVESVVLKAHPSPAEKSATYVFSEETALDMTLLHLNLQGEVFERTSNDYSVKQSASRVFTDTFTTNSGAPMIRRQYAAFETGFEMTNNRNGAPKPFGHAVGKSPLQGSTVEIQVNDSGTMKAAVLAEGSEPAEIEGFPVQPVAGLDHVEGRNDCAGLLPVDPKPVEPGASWSVDPSALSSVITPGGDAPAYFGPIQNQRDPDFLALYGSHSISRQVDAVTGTAKASLLTAKEEDGVTLATIQLEYDVTLERDPAEWMHTQCAPFEMAKVGQTATNARHALGLKGTGTLVWDVTNHRMVSVELNAESSSDLAFDYEFHHMGMDFGGDDHLKFKGRTTLKLSAWYDN